MNTYYVGLMSGTSTDAIDAVLVDFDSNTRLIASYSLPIPQYLRDELLQLNSPGFGELDAMGHLDQTLGDLFAQAALALIHQAGIEPSSVIAIGSHGQTIRHRPPEAGARGFTLQIGDPNIIAQTTGITTVADFRQRDMALGGQGAPLVPGFHRALFQSPDADRVLLNIGGIANITWLGRDDRIIGFDTGPGNCLMDAWIQRQQEQPYDRGGRWASQGKVSAVLLSRLLSHSYFQQPHPKSTGRETFNLDWLAPFLAQDAELAAVDVQATLLELTCLSISQSISTLTSEPGLDIYVCGGGAYNTCLMQRLQELAPQHTIQSTQALGLAPDWIEAMAFAWLAQQTLEGKPGNLCQVTGAREQTLLGGIYPGRLGLRLLR